MHRSIKKKFYNRIMGDDDQLNSIEYLDLDDHEGVVVYAATKSVKDRETIKIEVDADSQEVDSDEPTQLFTLIEKQMWTEAMKRCLEYPQEARIWMCRLRTVESPTKKQKKEIHWRILPIHCAVVLHAPMDLIQELIFAYPQGLEKGDDKNMTPAHCAFKIGLDPDVTQVLVGSFPEALLLRDEENHTPLDILKAYRRKYRKNDLLHTLEQENQLDVNRRELIRLYLVQDSDDHSDDGSDTDDFTYDSESDFDDDDLFYDGMFEDVKDQMLQGLNGLPTILKETQSILKDAFDCKPKR